MMRDHWHSLRYLLRHKRYVFVEYRALNIPLWIAILHDWDKFLPDEWFSVVNMKFASGGTTDPKRIMAYKLGRMKHHRRNKHHWEYWVDISDCGEMDALPIPDVYCREMLADWRGAGKSMGKPDLLGWYSQCRATMIFHPETRQWLEAQLGYHESTTQS
jgi:hypothetical protein